MDAPSPLLSGADLDRLRAALAPYTVDEVQQMLGPVGRAAQSRGDLAGVARAVDAAVADGADPRVATPVRLFLLGRDVSAADARSALDPLPLAAATALVEPHGAGLRARLEIRPYGQDGGPPWWVVSDLGADARPGPLPSEHVLGVGAAGLTLAQSTPRDPVRHALDLGTGCGLQALHLATHAGTVTATDVSPRAIRLAATTAALSGQHWDLRRGSWLEPVAGSAEQPEQPFDLVVANPPFVISPGGTEHVYRDSGRPGDAVCRDLVAALPGVLSPGGTAQLLANWIVPADGDWRARVGEWFAGTGCDAWVWQREVADLAEYVTMWLRDAGHRPGTAEWDRRYATWLDWFAAHDVPAVGMGLVTMWRSDDGGRAPVVVLEDVPQPVQQPCGAQFPAWIGRARWLAARDDTQLLSAQFSTPSDLVRARGEVLTDGGWSAARQTLRQSGGLRWELEVDDAVAGLVAACAGGGTPALAVQLLAATGAAAASDVAAALAPVVRDLVARGFLVPADSPADGPAGIPGAEA